MSAHAIVTTLAETGEARAPRRRDAVQKTSPPDAPSRRFTLAAIPAPVQRCNGQWYVPLWTPDDGWVLSMNCGDETLRAVPRAQCPDRDCDQMHKEDFDEWNRARTPRARRRIYRRRVEAHSAVLAAALRKAVA